MDNSLVLVFGLLCAALGYYMFEDGRRLRQRLRECGQWPSTEGEVVNSRLRKRITAPGSGSPTSHAFQPLVEYRYQVGDDEYTGTVIELGGRFLLTFWMANRQVKAYPPGRRVTVYYDPDDPATACLVRGGGGAQAKWLGGMLTGAFGLAVLVYWLSL